MNSSVIIFPGSNCDRDMDVALKKFGFKNKMIWHNDSELPKNDLVVLPGGFSYGDYLRTGAIAKFSPIMKEVVSLAKKGIPVIGICNGFQILLESGLLPGSLINNKNIKFLSKMVELSVVTNNTIFTRKIDKNKIFMPIAHKEGNYIADKKTIDSLEENNQIVFKYNNNPNGSMNDIAGIINKERNVLGMMPHPERACSHLLGSEDGKFIFESMLEV